MIRRKQHLRRLLCSSFFEVINPAIKIIGSVKIKAPINILPKNLWIYDHKVQPKFFISVRNIC